MRSGPAKKRSCAPCCRRTATRAGVLRYKVEPYVSAADVYSVAPHVGRGGWTWYTGSAGWLYQAGVESILGLRVQADSLVIDPCIPTAWPEFCMRPHYRGAVYEITVRNPRHVSCGVAAVELDGASQAVSDGKARVKLCEDRGVHAILVTLGPRTRALGYLRLAAIALAGLELAEANGEVETTTFALFCLGFLTSRLLRRCFCDMGTPSGRAYRNAGHPRSRPP